MTPIAKVSDDQAASEPDVVRVFVHQYQSQVTRLSRPTGTEIRFPDNWHKITGEEEPHLKHGPRFKAAGI